MYTPESLYHRTKGLITIHPMTTSSLILRYFLVLSLLTLFLLPVSTKSAPTPAESISPAADEPLSVILMIGDGMGFEHVELARLVEVGEGGLLTMQQLPWNASVATHCADEEVTDSGAAATAMATGEKTNKNYVGVDAAGNPLETILEYAQTLNKSTGVVSKCRIVDATPAAFMTHVISRYDQAEMTRQIVEEAEVDVLLGGGLFYFSSAQLSTMESNGYSVVYDRTSMLDVTSGKILGLFADIHMDYELDRNHLSDPSIAEMTNKSLELLSQDPDGFFLMVEAGRIDLAAHDEDKERNALETIEFDEAVRVALDYVEENSNTILIVTADHETEGLVVLSHDLNSTLPGTLGTHDEKEVLRLERVNDITVDWTANYHTATPVPIYCYGSAFEGLPLDMTIDNTNIYTLMKDYYDGNVLTVTQVSTTTHTTPSTTTTTTSLTPTLPTGDSSLLIVSAVAVVAIAGVIAVLIRRR